VSVPRVAAEPPPGWVAADIEPPKIAESAGASITTWRASQSSTSAEAFVTGCVATPIPGWVEDMRPAVEARTVALAGASAAKITGAPVDARSEEGVLALRAAADLGGPFVGRARTFVGFDESRVFTCFATCARRAPVAGPRTNTEPLGCERSVLAATLEGSRAPPQAGLALRGATWAVHHPRPTAAIGAMLVVLFGVLAVVFRRRPRSNLHRR